MRVDDLQTTLPPTSSVPLESEVPELHYQAYS